MLLGATMHVVSATVGLKVVVPILMMIGMITVGMLVVIVEVKALRPTIVSALYASPENLLRVGCVILRLGEYVQFNSPVTTDLNLARKHIAPRPTAQGIKPAKKAAKRTQHVNMCTRLHCSRMQETSQVR